VPGAKVAAKEDVFKIDIAMDTAQHEVPETDTG
jgi:hypothetical protein